MTNAPVSVPPKPALGFPDRIDLDGRYTILQPISPHHAPALHAATAGEGEADRYRWLFSDPPRDEQDLRERIEAASVTNDPLTFAVVDKATNRAVGQQALMRIFPEHGTIEIGAVLWGRGAARTRIATEAVFLFAEYAFEGLGYRRYEWKCNNLNLPSQRAAKRFGFTFEGVFRQHMIIKGESRDTAWFSMLDNEWPAIKAEYVRWLSPDNFDANGQQLTQLRFE